MKDHRRQQGQRYKSGHILLFSVLGMLSGATSYRKIEAFISHHYQTRDAYFGLNWKRRPAYTSIRTMLQGVSASELEKAFRAYRAYLAAGAAVYRS